MARKIQPILEPGTTLFNGAVVPSHVEEMAGLMGVGMTEKQQRMLGDFMVRGYSIGMEPPAEFDVAALPSNPNSLIFLKAEGK